MPDEVSARRQNRGARDASEVATTVHQIGDVKIESARQGRTTLITVTGCYTPEVAKYVETLARRARGDLGLEFRPPEGANGESKLRFDTTVLRMLKSIQDGCARRGHAFSLCSPPGKLIDMLRLSNMESRFTIVTRDGIQAGIAAEPAGQGPLRTSKNRPTERSDPQEAGRRIFYLNTSLKRTASLEKDLDSAAKCVQRFLPNKSPEVDGFTFAFDYRSSEKVGGDFFDFIPLDDHRIGISIGDVSGHGIHSAIVMGICRKLISVRATDSRFTTPAEVLSQVNRDLSTDLNRQTFVTALYGELDIDSGTFRFARAGHEPPLLLRRGKQTETIQSRGVALGLGVAKLFDSQIEAKDLTIGPGEALLLVTDGIAECRNEKEAIYSRERLVFESSRSGPSADAHTSLEIILEKIRSFAGDRSQEDDMTALLIQRATDN